MNDQIQSHRTGAYSTSFDIHSPKPSDHHNQRQETPGNSSDMPTHYYQMGFVNNQNIITLSCWRAYLLECGLYAPLHEAMQAHNHGKVNGMEILITEYPSSAWLRIFSEQVKVVCQSDTSGMLCAWQRILSMYFTVAQQWQVHQESQIIQPHSPPATAVP